MNDTFEDNAVLWLELRVLVICPVRIRRTFVAMKGNLLELRHQFLKGWFRSIK